ncbi:thiamine ABC transporter substrate-binding protein [Treponema sp. OMZ 840]|uniref:thiamine ABC transporter substrate-binding protein n=1 Tax=Treponema sp. OMZ 840 TaxID=244313 RepID=UPI003D8B1DD8
MKTRLCILFLLITFIAVLPAKGKTDVSDARAKEVVVYAYDSFTADWGPGPELVKLFEAETGYKCTLISAGDAVQVLTRAALEKKAPQADVLLGIDNNQVETVKNADVLKAYKPAHADRLIPAGLILDSEWKLTPYDWSYFALIYDTQSGTPAPESLSDLTKSIYAKKLILMDPRTSTPGLGFAAWTRAVFGDTYLEYWKALKPSILTMAPGWDAGYGLFTAGEAPLVISYTTSPAYHAEYDKTDRYKALIFDEGHIMQIEGAGLVKGAPNEKGGKAFLDFLIGEKAQSVLPLTQWMYPVNGGIALPDSYKAAPKAQKTLTLKNAETEKAAREITSLLAK